jgi:hypothetical protein
VAGNNTEKQTVEGFKGRGLAFTAMEIMSHGRF